MLIRLYKYDILLFHTITLKEKFVKHSVSKNVRPHNPNQMQFFPPNVSSLIEKDHLSLVINDVVKILVLSNRYAKMLSERNPPFHPIMMLIILFIDGAYSPNISSKFVSVSDSLRYGQ